MVKIIMYLFGILLFWLSWYGFEDNAEGFFLQLAGAFFIFAGVFSEP